MSSKIEKHQKICNELNALYAKKNHDYGDSFHISFVEEGMAMARIRAQRMPSEATSIILRRTA